MSTEDDESGSAQGDRYGFAYGLTKDGDIRLNSMQRPARIFDEEAVIQDLKVALLTPKGSDPFRPEYGLDTLQAIGTSDTQLEAAIVDAIGPESDPRIQSVDDITVDRSAGDRETTRVRVELTLASGTATSFTFEPQRSRF